MTDLGKSVDRSFFFGASPEIKVRAKALRKRMTFCEKVLWQELRKNRLHNLYFRRQHPISHFIADFYCHELRLVVEVDGSIHNPEIQKDRDLNRTAELENLGIAVIRVSNNDVIRNVRKVSKQIDDEVKKRLKMMETNGMSSNSSTKS